MPLTFLLSLTAYLAVVAACARANNVFAVGLINTLTLAVLLFALVMAWRDRASRTAFWFGFLLFFAGLNAAYYLGSGSLLRKYTLADSIGMFVYSKLEANPVQSGELVHEWVWYSYLAHCFIAALLGVVGGIFAAKVTKHSTLAK
jgi:hypothetical protein